MQGALNSGDTAMTEIVAPGEVIGKAEEYLPGENVEVDEEGNLRAQVMGIVIRDNREHTISVKPIKDNNLPKINDVVYGRVVSTPNDRVVVVKILAVENNGRREQLKDDVTGIIPPSQLFNGRPGNASDIVGIGDIVRARVISRGPPYTLTIKEAQLGVVYSRCPRCGHPLKWRGNELLKCPNCGATVRRKVSLAEYWNQP